MTATTQVDMTLHPVVRSCTQRRSAEKPIVTMPAAQGCSSRSSSDQSSVEDRQPSHTAVATAVWQARTQNSDFYRKDLMMHKLWKINLEVSVVDQPQTATNAES